MNTILYFISFLVFFNSFGIVSEKEFTTYKGRFLNTVTTNDSCQINLDDETFASKIDFCIQINFCITLNEGIQKRKYGKSYYDKKNMFLEVFLNKQNEVVRIHAIIDKEKTNEHSVVFYNCFNIDLTQK